MIRRRDYVLETSAEGRSLVVTGPWSHKAAGILASGKADGLVLNYARGFCERSLALLDSAWPVRRLQILDRSIIDLEPIERLGELESLSVQAAASATLDLGALPKLRCVAGDWALIASTLSAVMALQSVITWQFDEVDLHAFRDHLALKRLTVKDAPQLQSLAGIGDLADLAVLEIVLARRLRDIDDLAGLAESLRELQLEDCRAIETIDAVQALRELRRLDVSECGDIASVLPVSSLTQLRTFDAWGSTRILDGDLSALAQLPALKEIRMRNRPSYTPAVTDLPAAVF